jgi:hypothetical protein
MRLALIAVLAVAVLSGTTAQAHHGYSAFEREHRVSIEGEIDHSILIVKTRDGMYTAEWQPYTSLRRFGVTNLTLKKGDYVVITGAPARDASAHKISMVTEMSRPSDGWSWNQRKP